MSVQYTTLQTIINRMKRWQTAASVEDVYLVRDIDEAIREYDRKYKWPWMLTRSSIRVFNDILIYPVDDNFHSLAILDNYKKTFEERARFRYTSIPEFLEDIDNRNDVAEIWDGGKRYLGIRYDSPGSNSRVVDTAQSDDNFTASGVADDIAEDSVVTLEDNRKSIRFTVTGSGTATVESTFLAFAQQNIERSYFFIDIYLGAVPTSVTLKIGSSASNYYSTSVTTQFSGQSLVVGWNRLAMDINTATVTGSPDTNALAYQSISLVGATASTCYISASYLRTWSLMDLWIYINAHVAVDGSTVPTKRYFLNEDQNTFEQLDRIIGDEEWVDVIMFTALMSTMSDKENSAVKGDLMIKRAEAWDDLKSKYPTLEPIMITQSYRFNNDFQTRGDYND
jgi:hypothetical protein